MWFLPVCDQNQETCNLGTLFESVFWIVFSSSFDWSGGVYFLIGTLSSNVFSCHLFRFTAFSFRCYTMRWTSNGGHPILVSLKLCRVWNKCHANWRAQQVKTQMSTDVSSARASADYVWTRGLFAPLADPWAPRAHLQTKVACSHRVSALRKRFLLAKTYYACIHLPFAFELQRLQKLAAMT